MFDKELQLIYDYFGISYEPELGGHGIGDKDVSIELW